MFRRGLVDVGGVVDLSKFVQALIQCETTPQERHSKLTKLHKYVDGCRIVSKRIVEARMFAVEHTWIARQEALCQEIIAVVEAGAALEKTVKISPEAIKFDKVKKARIEVCEHLAQVTFDPERPESYRQSEAYLSRARQIIMDHDLDPMALVNLLEETKWISTSYYNMGVAFHQKGLFKEAVAPLRSSCQLAQLVPSPAWSRWEVLSLAQQKAGDIEGAARSLIDLIAVIFSRGSAATTTLQERTAKMNILLERILALYLEGSRRGVTLASFASMLQENEVTKQDQVIRILENCARSITVASSEALQIKHDLIQVLLQKTDGAKLPQRRARFASSFFLPPPPPFASE